MKQTLAITILLASLFWLSACGTDQRAAAPSTETVSGLTLETVTNQHLPDTFEAVGTIRSATTAIISSQILASVVSIQAREGDTVKRGQELAVLDDREVAARRRQASAAWKEAQQGLAAAEASYRAADATFRRYQTLVDKHSVARQEFDDVEARYKSAAAARQAAQARIEQAHAAVAEADTYYSYSRLRAPVSGVVAERKVDAGSLASPGMPLFVVEDTSRYRLEAAVEESRKGAVRLKQPVRVRLDALGGEMLAGTVDEIVPAVDPATRTFLVKIALPPRPAVRGGMFGRAEFALGERKALTVPASAVLERGQLEALYVVGDGTIRLRFVTTGKRFPGDRVEILSGLAAGERVVVNPGSRPLDGKRAG